MNLERERQWEEKTGLGKKEKNTERNLRDGKAVGVFKIVQGTLISFRFCLCCVWPEFLAFQRRHFVKVRLQALSVSDLKEAGNKLEAALTSQQQSVRTCIYIYTYTLTNTPTYTTHTGTFSCTHKDARLIIQPSPCSHLFLVSKVIFFPSLLLFFHQFLPHSPHFILTYFFFFISYLFCLFSILCPACCVCWIWSAFHVYHAIGCRSYNLFL